MTWDRKRPRSSRAVHIPWRTDYDPVRNDVCEQRAKAAVRKLIPQAEKLRSISNTRTSSSTAS